MYYLIIPELGVRCSNLQEEKLLIIVTFPGGSEVKASACNEGDPGSIPGSGRSPGEGNGNPLQYFCLENSMDRGAQWATLHRVAKSRTRLSDFTNLFSDLGRSFNLDDFKAHYPPGFLGSPWQQAISSEHHHVLTSSHPLRYWRLVKSGPFQILPAPGETIIFVRHLYNTLSSEFHALISTVMQSLSVPVISGPYTFADNFNPNFPNKLNLPCVTC